MSNALETLGDYFIKFRKMVRGGSRRRKKTRTSSLSSGTSDPEAEFETPVSPVSESVPMTGQLGVGGNASILGDSQNIDKPDDFPSLVRCEMQASNQFAVDKTANIEQLNHIEMQHDGIGANFEGFPSYSDSLGLGDLSDSDTILTCGQRPTSPAFSAEIPDSDSTLTCGQRPTFPALSAEVHEEIIPANPGNPLVVIIEPVPDERPITKFLANDLALSKALATSYFGTIGVKGVQKNVGKNLLIVTMDMQDSKCLAELLSTSQIGSWKVKCQLPLNHTVSAGVIGPFGDETLEEELTQELQLAGYDGATAVRIYKGKDKVKTAMFKVLFTSQHLPTYLYLGYQRFKVEPFVSKPWQCFKCQGFNHNASNCKGPSCCVGCGGPHNVKDCSSSRSLAPKCCNCGGIHTANYGGCPRMKFELLVEKARSVKKMSYRDAVKHVKETSTMSRTCNTAGNSSLISSPHTQPFHNLPSSNSGQPHYELENTSWRGKNLGIQTN